MTSRHHEPGTSGWQDYLDELRMLDEGCPNCEPPPPEPALASPVRIARPAPPRRQRTARVAVRRWIATIVTAAVDTAIKVGVALFLS